MPFSTRTAALALVSLAALSACAGEEESVEDKFNRLAAEVENKGQAYQAQAENMVSQEERLRDLEADALQRQAENAMGNSANSADLADNAASAPAKESR